MINTDLDSPRLTGLLKLIRGQDVAILAYWVQAQTLQKRLGRQHQQTNEGLGPGKIMAAKLPVIICSTSHKSQTILHHTSL